MSRPPVTILLCALGGEGGGVLSQWLYDVAVASGHAAQSTSIPGVAQRTGATTYYVEIAPDPTAAAGGVRPIFSLNPVPGAVDLLVSSELLETVRQIAQGMADAARTTVITSNARALTVAEKMVPSDGRVDDAALLAVLQRHTRRSDVMDFGAMAREAGTVNSAVLLGAVAASGVLPFARAAYEDTIRRSGKGVEASLRGFALAFEAMTARHAQQAQVARLAHALHAGASDETTPAIAVVPTLPQAWRERLPEPAHALAALAHARLLDYQDAAYAELYVQRLARIAAADTHAHGDVGRPDAKHAATVEVARWLALWMAFDDIVRVAHLKLRAPRVERVRKEIGARDDDVVRVRDHFKPGVPEIAALLPPTLAQRLVAWDTRRRARGREPWAMPLAISNHTIIGVLALKVLAAMKPWRRRGSRYLDEQALIERWLAGVEQGLSDDPALGLEVARGGRLIKGYGSTHERGRARLLHIVDHVLPSPRPAAQRAHAVAEVLAAALAEADPSRFDAALRAHGAPPAPLRAQPIRWFKRRPKGVTTAP